MRNINYYFHVVNLTVALKIIGQLIKSLLISQHLLWHLLVRYNPTRAHFDELAYQLPTRAN